MCESVFDNNLFFTCSLIEFIARKTKNTKSYVVKVLGHNNIKKIYDLASVYHSENIDKVADEFISLGNLQYSNYDVCLNVNYRVPSYYEVGRIYKRLIVMVNGDKDKYVDTLEEVMNSWIISFIDNYNSSMYYENSSYIYACYVAGKIL